MRLSFILFLLFQLGCAKWEIKRNPEIVFNALKENPMLFLETLKEVQKSAMKQNEQKQMDKMLKGKRFEVKVDPNRVLIGKKDAPITIIEYSDFECPYCSRGYATMKQVIQEYGDKVRLVYKHLPLDFHPLAEPASLYFEALFLQDKNKALKFHDEIFENQGGLKKKKHKFLDELVKKVGGDLAKVKKDIRSEKLKKIVADDKKEAGRFGISGTPGFLVNGIAIKGAYPFPTFKKVIDHLLKEN